MAEVEKLSNPIKLDVLPGKTDHGGGRPSIWRDRLQSLIDADDHTWTGFEQGPITLMRVKRNNFRTGKLGRPAGHEFDCEVRRLPHLPDNLGVIFFKWLGPKEDNDTELASERQGVHDGAVVPDRVLHDLPAGDGPVLPPADEVGEQDAGLDEAPPDGPVAGPEPVLEQPQVVLNGNFDRDPAESARDFIEALQALEEPVSVSGAPVVYDLPPGIASAEEIQQRWIPTGEDEPLMISGNLPVEEPTSDDDIPEFRPEGLEDL